MVRPASWLTAALLTLQAVPVAAKSADLIALFLAPQEGADATLSTAVAEELARVAGERALAGNVLKRRINREPELAAGACGPHPACLAKLGKQARVNHVFYVHITAAGAGVKVEILVIKVATQALDRQIQFEADSAAGIAARVGEKRAELFGAPAVTGDDGELTLAMIEIAPLVPAAAPAATRTGADPMDDLELAVLPTEPAPSPTGVTAADARRRDPTDQRSRSLMYAGAGVAGVGVVSLAVGTIYGIKGMSLPNSIERGGGGTTMAKAAAVYDDSERATRRANLFFAIGGVAVAIGAGLVSVDLLILGDPAAPSGRVEIGAAPNSAWVRYAW